MFPCSIIVFIVMYLPGSVVCYLVDYFDFRAADFAVCFHFPLHGGINSVITHPLRAAGSSPASSLPHLCRCVFDRLVALNLGVGRYRKRRYMYMCVYTYIVIDIYMSTSRFALCAPRVLLFMRMCHYQQIDLIPCLPLFSSPTCLISPSHISCCRFLGLLLDAR